jgi:outer membrane protein assembly factor BamB
MSDIYRVLRLLILPFLLTVTGCGTFDNLFGSDKDEKVEGDRVSIMTLTKQTETDARLAGTEIILPPPYVNEEWPQPGGYADHAMHHLAAGDELKELWSVRAGDGSDKNKRLTAEPIVAEGQIYVLDASSTIRAFDAKSGERLWDAKIALKKEKIREGFGGGLAYEKGKLVGATGLGVIAMLEAKTGKEIWRKELGLPIRVSPTMNGERIFIITHDNQLLCFAAADGRELWRHRGIVESASFLSNTAPAVASNTLVAPFSSGEVFAIRVQTGTPLWSDSLTRTGRLTSLSEINDIAGRPVIDRDRVIAASHAGRMVALDLRSGERVWTRDIASVQTPWVAGDFLFVLTTEAELLCMSRADGGVIWVMRLQRYEDEEDREDPIEWSGPVLVGDRLLVVSSHGYALAVSPYSGKILGKIELPDRAFIAPVVADGIVYLLTDDAELVALR